MLRFYLENGRSFAQSAKKREVLFTSRATIVHGLSTETPEQARPEVVALLHLSRRKF